MYIVKRTGSGDLKQSKGAIKKDSVGDIIERTRHQRMIMPEG